MSSPGTAGRGTTGRGRFAATAVLLVTLTAPPIAALVVPATVQYVLEAAQRDLELGDARRISLIRAVGLALPALLLTVPLAAVAVRKLPAWLVLPAGLCAVLGGEFLTRTAATVPLIGTARVLQGVGAGLVLPATLVLVWERRRPALAALWAGALAAGLLLATPLALRAVPPAGAPDDWWRTVLQPQPWLLGAALVATVICIVVRVQVGGSLPAMRHTERTQLMLPVVPAAGFAVLAVMATYGWSPEAQLVVAGLALAALLGLAVVGSRDASTGSPLGVAVVMLGTGLLTFPLATPLAGLIGTTSGPGGVPAVPFAAGAGAALLGALAAVPLSRNVARGAVLTGHGLAVVGVLMLLTVGPGSSPYLLMAPLIALGGGVGLALAASLRGAPAGAALFGLALCFPAVLTGQIAVASLQTGRIQRLGTITEREQYVYGLTAGYRLWLIVAGVLVVILAGAVVVAGRRREEDRPAMTNTPTPPVGPPGPAPAG